MNKINSIKNSNEKVSAASATAGIWTDQDDWIEDLIPQRPWVVPHYLLRGSVTVVVGPPSSMKSSLMLGWACSAALGTSYGRFKPHEPVRVVVYNVEDDADEQKRRLSATILQFNPSSLKDLKGRIVRSGPNGVGTLFERKADGNIRPTLAMANLEKLFHSVEGTETPSVLIVDPMAELHNCDENDNTAIRAVIAEFRRMAVQHNIAVVLVHHTRKGASASPGDPDIARGASAIIGAARVVVTLTTMSEEDAKSFGLPTDVKSRSHYVRLDDGKSNYGPIGDPAWFEKKIEVIGNNEGIAAAAPWTPPSAKLATDYDLATIVEDLKRGCAKSSGEPYSPKLDTTNDRSIMALLEQRGFKGKDSQVKVIKRLEKECNVKSKKFRSGSRNDVLGLQVDGLPAAKWID